MGPREVIPTQWPYVFDFGVLELIIFRNLVTAQIVFADSLVDGEECWISNGLRGFICGKVKLH